MGDFDFSNGYVILRIMCGFILIPHTIGKITNRQAALDFFNSAGFRPPTLWANIALVVELVLAVAMIAGFETRYVALILFAYMLVCAAAVIKVTRQWLWHLGGCEYCVFLALSSLIVALTS
jgi:uncharacterized membrane protein YphA (DoxX/SURF4 family)